ncbi:conserved hypothetical protein [Bathymodiolus platifrons methanotrophic gill symbiont]|uniref:hypothetical protein n=1 Tax=Bathymodiolus platifrons methanotrophic gill symbiont TaxID=113268 RepID=UPI000B418ED8|nr:hypothetical protein [Bathymodiolus platifrons methanotrophic gill symbiont]TXK93512.1 hypothetical protein BMR10_15645 [Methylococcaceae bacterium CS4]GAW87508.1 conserved hypothetical protein [Bathymodiolus platifrons methanotrophic gill symbiont]GFO75203.1 hypothetical protein BPLS_P2281 [Bathymodiolus platifrons methanotrophic gill symbiont]
MVSENTEAISNFITYLSVKQNKPINNILINPLVKRFFESKGVDNYSPIEENYEISDLDFKKVEISYFYDYIFNDINKNNEKIETPVKYCITIDKQNCLKKCEKTGILYDDFWLYKQPIFYFIYIDVKDIFSALRG